MQLKQIELDNSKHLVVDNGIIAINCNWEVSSYDKKPIYDKKYDVIQKFFKLDTPRNIVWLKFTTAGHLGVVAESYDINFDDDTSSGVLVNSVGENWDDWLVLIFSLTTDILNGHDKKDIEMAIGNYLISKEVPIIDFYSHNY